MWHVNIRKALKTALGLVGPVIAAPLWAGPPLAIDDPGIVDPGQWEIIAAASYSKTDSVEILAFPIADLTLGLTENLQVSADVPYVFADSDEDGSEDDFGNLTVGFAWRFHKGERLQLALNPSYLFGTDTKTVDVGVVEDEDIISVPVTAEYALGDTWRLNAQWGYFMVDEDHNLWGYGAALTRRVGSRAEMMFELYGGAEDALGNDVLNFNIGLDLELRPELHLLAAVGSGLRDERGDKLDFNAYLGIQFFR